MEAKRIEQVLNSLDKMSRAEAPPYLYSKLRNRLQTPEAVVPLRLAWRLAAALVIVAALNVITIRSVGNEPEAVGTGAEGVANEYSISLPQTY